MAESQSGHSGDEGEKKPVDEMWEELQTPVMHAAECQDSQCDVTDCKTIKRLFNHSSMCEVRGFGGCKVCQALWFLVSFHANSCCNSNCPVPTCMEWREYVEGIAKEPEPHNTEDVGKLLAKLAIDLKADPSAGKQQTVQLVEPESSKDKGALATGSAPGSGSGSGSVTVSTKSKVTAKILQEIAMASVRCSRSDQGLGSVLGRSARQMRMKRRVAEGSRKNRNQIQNKKQWDEYTVKDKKIIIGATFLIFFALFPRK